MTRRTKLFLAAGSLFMVGCVMFLVAVGLIGYFSSAQNAVPSFVVRDSNSPTVVRVDGIKPLYYAWTIRQWKSKRIWEGRLTLAQGNVAMAAKQK
jgi:hypothetical protein